MKRFLTTTLVATPLVLGATLATAGGLGEPVIAAPPVPAAVLAPAPVVTGSNRTGPYAGLSLGYGTVDAEGVTDEFEGLMYGAHAGYNYDLGNVVVGGEFELSRTDDFINDSTGLELDSVARLKAKVGYDAGAFLPYATAGFARVTVSDIEEDGYFYGVGVDYALSDAFTLGGEVLRHEFEDFNGTTDITADTVALRVSYNF